MTLTPLKRKRVGIFPHSGFESEKKLLASLAKLYPVDFSPAGEKSFDQMDAAIFFSDEDALANHAFEHGVSSFVFRRSLSTTELPANVSVSFSGHANLHPAFRNARILAGRATEVAEFNPAEVDNILASYDSLKLWVFRSNGRAELHTVGTELPSLENDRLLWQELRPDGWLAPLPLMHFVRRLTAGADWLPVPQNACFIFDDPNLHSVRYGYIDYAALAAHARAHNYHVATATIPFDAWHAGRNAVDVFRSNGTLSLLVHGNDHIRNELGCDYNDGDALCMLAQALRRVAHLERRTGLHVERVIVPPHGGCSESILAQAPRLAIEAVCTSAEPLAHCQNPASLPLEFGLLPAWFGPGCCPVIRRSGLVYGLMPLRLAAFLGQPIIASGHHQDCAQGFGTLAEIANAVNSWGPTSWTNVTTILRRNFRTMRDGELMHVQMCSRSVIIVIPEGVSHLVVHSPVERESFHGQITLASTDGQVQECTPDVPFRLIGAGTLQLRMHSSEAIDPAAVGRPRIVSGLPCGEYSRLGVTG